MSTAEGRAYKSLHSWGAIERLAFFLRPMLRNLLGHAGRASLQALLGGRVIDENLPVEACASEPWWPDRPLLSVIIPCFNGGSYLLQALRSLGRQTFRDFEVIVVDDGSHDPLTLRLLARLEHCQGLSLLRQNNAGPGAARNYGIAHASGRYVCCLDADDYLAPDYLEKCVVVLEGDSGVRLAHSWMQLFGEERRLGRTLNLDVELLRYVNHLGVAAVFHRSDWLAAGGFSEARECLYEDWDFWIRLASLGIRGRVLEEALLYYRRHGETRLHDANRRAFQGYQFLRHAHDAFYTDAPWRRNLVRGYSRRLVSTPMSNLSRPQQYRHYPNGVSLLHVGDPGEISSDYRQALRELPPGQSLQVIVEHDEKLPDWLCRNAELIYRLPALLDRSQWPAFVENFLKTRNVVRRLSVCAGKR
ncbi:glycosyltransferase family A protein [Pseudomonas jinjuensis]|uniref:Glycosyltransferase involved in cell wall bisynthesis n=1 Tax=Pseudomonas jinjuensis TaxID=198616 RepID=A0A1G9YFL2_9PSED|nr:glycosyltransferase family A protein [Pseudomonas jinjuensis]SDN07864.1 Glycosyltransferase involved in cell wall bisynthesis [Pseudomonas jinjuensis]